jgi:hypothetical protein
LDIPQNREGMHYEVPLYLSRGSCRAFRRRACGVGFVGQHDALEVCGEVSFERPSGVARWFAFGDFLVVVRAAGAGRYPDLDHRDGVDRGVQVKHTRFHAHVVTCGRCAFRPGVERSTRPGTIMLVEMYSGAVAFNAVTMERSGVGGISGGSVELGDLIPDREALGHFGSPSGRAEPMPSRPKMWRDAAKGRQEPLGMPHRFEAFHRPFALSGGLMRVLGPVIQIPRPPVLHRRHELTVSDLVAAQLVGDQHARHVPQALEQLAEESLGRHRVSV